MNVYWRCLHVHKKDHKINLFICNQFVIVSFSFFFLDLHVLKDFEKDLSPLPHMPILGSSNSEANKNMISKIWTNSVQLFERIENIIGKGEIAPYERFLLFPQCFQKLSCSWVKM